MKKLLGIFIFTLICILGLCSCASPEQKAVNQDLVDRLNKGQVVAEDCYIKLYDIVNEKYYSIVDMRSVDPTNSNYVMVLSDYDKPMRCSLIIQYSNYIKIYYNASYTWDKKELANYEYTILGDINDGGFMEVSNNRVSYIIIR